MTDMFHSPFLHKTDLVHFSLHIPSFMFFSVYDAVKMHLLVHEYSKCSCKSEKNVSKALLILATMHFFSDITITKCIQKTSKNSGIKTY